jgi:4-hydroxy-tetrahydrodipicolinate reductase
VREGEVPGTHSITYHSQVDEISLKHEAFSRDGFALGAVIAAEWILNKKGVFSMQDVLNIS